MKNKNLIPKEAVDILTEDSVTKIEAAIQDKIQLAVEGALVQQDDVYASKLEALLEALDKDTSAKFKRSMRMVDANNSKKLKHVVGKYEGEITKNAKAFKATLVESISNYLEEFLDEAVPAEAINEATRNRTAATVLSQLRNVLAVDSTLMSESVKDAVLDGQKKINALEDGLKKSRANEKKLLKAYNKTRVNYLLEEKTSSLPKAKSTYLKRVLADKTPTFIEENFDYTSRLFDKKDEERLSEIKTEAFKNRKVKADAPKVITEKKVEPKTQVSPYLEAMATFK